VGGGGGLCPPIPLALPWEPHRSPSRPEEEEDVEEEGNRGPEGLATT
jgi:hypothetical protein